VANQDFHTEEMMGYPLGLPLSGKTYYYVKDNRMAFDENIVSLDCSDWMQTCVYFEDSTSTCFGNTSGVPIFDDVSSFLFGVNVALVVGLGVFWMDRLATRWETSISYVLLLLSLGLILCGSLPVSRGSYVVGTAVAAVVAAAAAAASSTDPEWLSASTWGRRRQSFVYGTPSTQW
jgi:hypothetical protein